MTVSRKNFGPLVVALLSAQLLIALWATYRIDDVFWQLRRADTQRAELVAKQRALLSSGKLALSPTAQKQFAALLRLLESDDANERSMVQDRVELGLRQVYLAAAIFATQLILSLFMLFRPQRARGAKGAVAETAGELTDDELEAMESRVNATTPDPGPPTSKGGT